MLPAVNAVVLVGVLLCPWMAASAFPVIRDTSSLQFFGFRAGAPLNELTVQLSQVDGGPLRCKRSKRDHRVSECRARFTSAELGRVDLWVSAIDSLAGVMTLSAKVDSSRLERWREALLNRYGRVGARIQGSQSMLQWVRRGRMLRLTWRSEAGEQVASVSLVDGHVLDNWGRARSGPAR